MKITQITYARGATINLGNFNSGRFDLSVTIAIQDGEDADEKFVAARDWVAKRIQADVKASSGTKE